ncbi:unnamed protein product [Caenorhabditis angaria]|uniref:Progestin and adipoQ receptor family member 3 n=1 Tax=Caenorhabditis angaria TaxID=860376 RepID=A0A9P1IQ15_9PELO|nr:unnamed protein product [Caenorhabditis angaria]
MRKNRCVHCHSSNVCHSHEKYRLVTKDKLHKTLWLNDYVVNHYRPPKMTKKMCAKSIFHINNETINIWSHLIGFIYFTYQQYDINYRLIPSLGSHKSDHLVYSLSLLGMQICMLFSASYHTFGCSSIQMRQQWLKMDIFGISAGLLGMYLVGIYTAFFCFNEYMTTYIYAWFAIFMVTAYVPTRQDFFEKKVVGSRIGLLHIIYCIIISFGVLPSIHWVILHGGFENGHVMKWFPNIIILYGLIATAFIFYVTMIPERLCPGKFDVVGCSHQWWHMFILAAMVYWQRTGNDLLAEYRLIDNSCHISIGSNFTLSL